MVTTSGYRRGWHPPARRADVGRAAATATGRTVRHAAAPATGPTVRHAADPAVRRPPVLALGAVLFGAAATPFVLLAAAASALPTRSWLGVLGQWPNLTADQHTYRLLGGGLALLAVGYLVLAVRAGLGSGSARTGVTVLTAVYDATLFVVLLADPRPGWLFLGAGVLLVSLAAVVLCYQPDVDRYLAERAL